MAVSEALVDGSLRHLAKGVFVLALIGCELNVIGLVTGFGWYWHILSAETVLLQITMVAGPLLYIALSLAFTFSTSAKALELDKDWFKGKEYPSKLAVNFSYCHWIPFYRIFSVMMKTPLSNDIESVLLANMLSSFTYGPPQLAGIFAMLWKPALAGHGVSIHDLPFEVKLNSLTLAVSSAMTICCVLTPLSQFVKANASLEAVIAELTRKLAQYELLETCMLDDVRKQLVHLQSMEPKVLDDVLGEQFPLELTESQACDQQGNLMPANCKIGKSADSPREINKFELTESQLLDDIEKLRQLSTTDVSL